MNKISIQVLTQNKNNSNNKLDVYSISHTKTHYPEIESFNSQSLIASNITKREKLLDTYMKYYNCCIEKIKTLNSRNKVDLLYDVPVVVPDCPSYSHIKCIEFIERKLNAQHFDTYKLKNENNVIFITWKFLESNLNNH